MVSAIYFLGILYRCVWISKALTASHRQTHPIRTCSTGSMTCPKLKLQSLIQLVVSNLGVSINGGTPNSSILKGFSLINHPAIGVPPWLWNAQNLWCAHGGVPMAILFFWRGWHHQSDVQFSEGGKIFDICSNEESFGISEVNICFKQFPFLQWLWDAVGLWSAKLVIPW